jgi:hypothetical protein
VNANGGGVMMDATNRELERSGIGRRAPTATKPGRRSGYG